MVDVGFNPRPALMTGLELRGVSHRYGSVVAVDDVTVSVAPGQVVGLLGPSGCGKTTLLRVAAGLETLQQGEVSIDGRRGGRSRRIAPSRGTGRRAGFPGLRAVPAPDRCRQCGVRPRAASAPGATGSRAGRVAAGWPARSGGGVPAHAEWRPAAAGGAGPGGGARPGRDVAGRAVRRAGPPPA